MKVLVSGAGIAGPTLAYWLLRCGMTPTLVERAPALRTGGYIIDFWGAGYDVATRMNLLPEVRQAGYTVRDVRIVNSSGRRISGFPTAAFTRATGGGFTSVRRGDLAATIFGALGGSVETIFGDTITQIDQTAAEARVTFERHPPRTFDIVVGADGLHSRVRQLVFGPQRRFERYLGIKVAAFAVAGYRPRDELTYVMYPQVGHVVSRFSMRDDRTMFLFTFTDDNPEFPTDIQAQKAVLRERFGSSGWECPRILDALATSDDLYFDRVSQIEIGGAPGAWTTGRVTLIGDAASCISLLGGQGSALAMVAAYILAGELHRAGGRYGDAFAAYERLFGPFVAMKQRAARRFVGSFAPKSRASLFVANQIMRILSNGWIADLVAGRAFSDRITLPDY